MRRTLRFATFLAPNMYPVYRYIAGYVGKRLAVETELIVGSSFDQFAAGQVDAGYICGLPYVLLARQNPRPVEAFAAPVLQGSRYQGKPVYYSDVIVRVDRPYQSFKDLRGCTWSYNDTDSQSGYGITRFWLARMGETGGFFGKVVEAGFHQRSIQMVFSGHVDASAIDSQVLAIELRENPELSQGLKVIDSLGPSTIQPVVAASHLPANLIEELRGVFLEIGDDAESRDHLSHGFVERFAAVSDETYDDIRDMLSICETLDFMKLK